MTIVSDMDYQLSIKSSIRRLMRILSCNFYFILVKSMHDSNEGVIKRLNDTYIDQLVSGAFIDSFEACAKTLVQNSLDSGANNITFKIDFESLSICIEDDGEGIKKEDLLGICQDKSSNFNSTFNPYDAHSLATWDRKSVLRSLISISFLTVISKSTTSSKPYVARYLAKDSYVKEYELVSEDVSDGLRTHFGYGNLSGKGTIIIATSIFSKTPVRYNYTKGFTEKHQIEKTKFRILESLLNAHNVNFELYKICRDSEVCVPIAKIGKIEPFSFPRWYNELFDKLLGPGVISVEKRFEKSKNGIEVDGVVGSAPYYYRNFQLVFLGRRQIELSKGQSSKLRKLLSNIKQKLDTFSDHKYNTLSEVSPRKKRRFDEQLDERFPIIILRIIQNRNAQASDYIPRHTFNFALQGDRFIEVAAAGITEAFNLGTSIVTLPPDNFTLDNGDFSGKRLKRTLASRCNEQHSIDYKKLFSHADFALNTYKRERDSLINNPKYEYTVTNAKLDISLSKDQVLTKKIFDNSNWELVNQVNSSFIIIKVKSSSRGAFLAAIDQHACDERIQVERLLKSYTQILFDPNLQNQHELVDHYSFTVSDEEISLLQEYRDNFSFFGFLFDVCPRNTIRVTHVPYLLQEKYDQDRAFLRRSILQHLTDLSNHVKKSNINTLSSLRWLSVSANLPKILIDTINSRACKSAVKFGDTLNFHEMHYLVSQLSECEMPFQCAHGRPSIVPLAFI
ncbi:Piso0_001844 [Millerozyma farinosa CBS 7064]|uniref:Piso0_001844 protein n=1 Tax=Pichia sorbitophila (strain ATCC MYA-4447 / BCRC 22081 / CBS 7064 / NBRC 10061 / NRRL Y-12695) TaxID=559304 RepID=G8YLW2_PICSO|nr:Piso0_001844 [Millerozyma farinosa CBS 7064]